MTQNLIRGKAPPSKTSSQYKTTQIRLAIGSEVPESTMESPPNEEDTFIANYYFVRIPRVCVCCGKCPCDSVGLIDLLIQHYIQEMEGEPRFKIRREVLAKYFQIRYGYVTAGTKLTIPFCLRNILYEHFGNRFSDRYDQPYEVARKGKKKRSVPDGVGVQNKPTCHSSSSEDDEDY